MTQIGIEDLFMPAPSGVGPGTSTATPVAGSWMAQNLANAATVGLTTTAWQPASPTRGWLEVSAIDQAKQDAAISAMIQGGFLDFAATGTVSYTDPNGVTTTSPVSPDPSDPASGNTNGAPTWLDLLASSKYNVQRIPQGPAQGVLAIVNTSATTPPTYAVGTYHAQSASNPGATYSNGGALTIPPSSILGGSVSSVGTTGNLLVTTSANHGLTSGASVYITGAAAGSNANGFFQVTVTGTRTFTLNGTNGGGGSATGTVYSTLTASFSADAPGPASSAAIGDISVTVTTDSGVSVSNLAVFTGVAYESNPALAARCRLKLASLSPGGAAGAYVFFALTAYTILLGTAPGFPVPAVPVALSCGPVSRAITVTSPLTGVVNVYVAPQVPTTTTESAPVVTGKTNLPILLATNATPIQIDATAHGLTTGQVCTISGVLGNTAANGTWTVTYVDANNFTLNGSSGTGTYTDGGQVEAGDLGEIDSVIQTWCVPDGDAGVTLSALTQTLAIAAVVTVPAAQRTAYINNVNSLLTSYVNAMPIGGLPLAGGGTGLPIDVVIGMLYQAGALAGGQSYVQNISGVTINGAATDCAYVTPYVGVLYPAPSLQVNGS
jgi:hypothetical protein